MQLTILAVFLMACGLILVSANAETNSSATDVSLSVAGSQVSSMACGGCQAKCEEKTENKKACCKEGTCDKEGGCKAGESKKEGCSKGQEGGCKSGEAQKAEPAQ